MTIQGKARQDKARQDKTRQIKTRRSGKGSRSVRVKYIWQDCLLVFYSCNRQVTDIRTERQRQADRPTERQTTGEIRLHHKMQKIRLTGIRYGLDFDQWLMPVSQSVHAAGYFIHIKKRNLFLTFRLTELIWAPRPRRFSETKQIYR